MAIRDPSVTGSEIGIPSSADENNGTEYSQDVEEMDYESSDSTYDERNDWSDVEWDKPKEVSGLAEKQGMYFSMVANILSQDAEVTHSSAVKRGVAPVRSHFYASALQQLERFGEIRDMKVQDILGDGSCGYYSVILSLYEEMRKPGSEIHRRMFENERIGNVPEYNMAFDMLARMSRDTLKRYSRFSEVPLCDANALAMFLRFLIAKEVLTNREAYRIPLVTDGGDEGLETEMESMLSTRHSRIEDTQIRALSNIFGIEINVIGAHMSKKGPMSYWQSFVPVEGDYVVDEQGSQRKIWLLFVNNGHYDVIVNSTASY